MAKEKNKGPIPPGDYEINSENISDPGIIGDIKRNLFFDWGDWRVKIDPKPGTETFGRRGFFLHGGRKKGSAGCIDIGGGRFGDRNTDRVLRDIKSDPDKRIPLIVK